MYLINPDASDALGEDGLGGVGFPKWAIFCHDDLLADSLLKAWQSGDAAGLSRLWNSATPLSRG